MAEETLHNSIAVASEVPHSEVKKELISADGTMILLTWITFFALLAILNKFAWKPILANLDAREAAIRKAVEDADKATAELEKINQTRAQLINEAELKGRALIEESRKAAVEAGKVIEQKARSEAQIILENAKREINEETNKAHAKIKQQAADITIFLAGKLIQKKLDDETSRKLVDHMIEEMD